MHDDILSNVRMPLVAAVRNWRGPLRVLVLLSVMLAAVSYACEANRSTPLAPTPPVSPMPQPPVSSYWNLTSTLTDVTGRSVCPHWSHQIGTSANWTLDVRRSTNALTLVYGDPLDALPLIGTINGDAFEASVTYASYQPCGGSRLNYQFESRVVGQFSPDGNGISARESWSYRVESGEALVMHFDWNARQASGR
jgi:hypothetical protein